MKKISLCACVLMTALANAQNSPVKSDSLTKLQDSLKEVTITATRSRKDIMDVGRSVTVISNEEIEQAGCNTVAELLSRQEGIFIVGAGQNPGAVQNLLLRGADDNNTTIMIDGSPITDPSSSDGAIDLSELSLADIDKIEIIRGSHSTLYGSSAIGGVINIITSNNYAPGLHLDVGETAGMFGPNTRLFEENALINYTFKKGLYVEGGYHRWDDKGLDAAVDTLKTPLPYQQNVQNNLDKGDAFSKIGFKNQKLNTYLEYRSTNQTFGIPEAAFSPANNYTGQLIREYYKGFFTYNITQRFHIQYTASYSPLERKYLQDTTIMDTYNDKQYQSQYYTSKTITHDVQLLYDYKTSQLIMGGGSNYQTMNSNTDYWFTGYTPTTTNLDSIRPSQAIYNIFGQGDIDGATFAPSLKALSLLIGARFSSNSVFGNNISYEINPSLKVGRNSLLYCSYSTGFDAPSLYEMYGPNDIPGNPISLANKTLTPETSASFEVGVKHRISNTYFTISYYNTVVSNHIDYVYIWNKHTDIDSLGYSDFLGDTYLNVGKETTQGFELNVFSQLDKKFSLSANMILLSSSLEYLASEIDTTHIHGNYVQIFDGGGFLAQNSGNIKITGLLRRPGAMANVSVTYKPVKTLSLTVMTRYVGTRTDAQYNPVLGPFGADAYTTLPDYILLDASVSYNVTKHLSATLRCGNLFNTTYYEILGYSTLGRSFYLNIHYSL